MKKVLLLGAAGMLGSAVYDVLRAKYDLVLSFKNKEESRLLSERYSGVENCQIETLDLECMYQDYYEKKGNPGEYFINFFKKTSEIDYVINAVGITIPFSFKNPALTFFINSAFPHILANIFEEKLIHITTDCVYNGKQGYPYNENSPKTPVDIYGISKALGEPINCLTLRTSIIGRELQGFNSLLGWFLQQEGKTIKGFAQHFWNGITTKEFGKVCDKIISNPEEYPKTGLYHIFSTTVSKYEMLVKFKEKFSINCEIEKDEEPKLNRTLATIYDFNKKLNIPSFDEMLKDL